MTKTKRQTGTSLRSQRITVLGAGKMGTILLEALLGQELLVREHARATVQHAERAEKIRKQLHIAVGTDNAAAVADADIVLICVKPGTVRQVLEEIAPALNPRQLLISIAASVPTSYMEKYLPPAMPLVRAMPNTPCAVRTGMTAICKGAHSNAQHLATACALFEAVGRTVVLDEKHMDAATALSASGPAYVYIILESLAEAGVKVGLPRDTATLMAAQTALGAARVVLDTGDHPALLKDAVTTPAGCTIDGILELEEGKLRVTLIKAVVKAASRAKELLFTE